MNLTKGNGNHRRYSVCAVSNQSSQRQNHGCGRTNKGYSFDTSLIDQEFSSNENGFDFAF